MIDLILRYDPEDLSEMDMLGIFLWENNLVGDMIACERPSGRLTAACADELFNNQVSAKEFFVLYMQSLHYLWKRANGSEYAPPGAGRRGLGKDAFVKLLESGCTDIMVEQRQDYHGFQYWTLLGAVHHSEKHWQCAVIENEGMFRRAIPEDDMHTHRFRLAELCYELIDDDGSIIKLATQEDAYQSAQKLIDRVGAASNHEVDIRVHISTPADLVYIECFNPEYKACHYKSWLTCAPGVIRRPFRYKLFKKMNHKGIAEEVPSKTHYSLGYAKTEKAVIEQIAANL